MSSATIVHGLQQRSFRLDEKAGLSGSAQWFDGNPLTTQLLNAYTILIPNGERFIIRSCRHYVATIAPELKEELERLFFQEGAHSREHRRVLEVMRSERRSLERFRSMFEWWSYRVLEPLTPASLHLATAAGIEHHNAVVATFFLEHDLLKGVRTGELRRLFLWHFAEEIEHKETVFKLLQSVSRSWWIRALGLFFSFATFLLYWGIGTLLLSLKARSLFTVRFWKEVCAQAGSKGLFAALTRESWRYLKLGFSPSLEESRSLLDSALTELARLERLAVERPFPPQFQRKMTPTMERYEEMQTTHPYFFSRIDSHAGAWVQSDGVRKLNFCSYSYLGLLHHPHIDDAAKMAIDRYGTGTQGVRLLGGNLKIHEQLESSIAAFFARDAAITFSSGYMTNLAVIGTLVGKGDFVLSDERNHASIVDGCRSSRAEVVKFKHDDMADLERKLGALRDGARKLIVVDAVYSMDGDIAPLPELIGIRDRHPNTILMVDEAHSLGVLGTHGRGIEEHFDCSGKIDVLMGTLSKTIPCQGGYVTGSHELITYLRYNARGFIFSASLSPVSAAASQAALEVIKSDGSRRRNQLMSNVRYFIRRLREEGFDVGNSETAIVPVLLGNESRAFEMAKRLNSEGVYVMPVVYPAVPRGTERLRLNVTCNHERADLDYVVQALMRVRERAEVRAPSKVVINPITKVRNT